jgi:chromosomal replication initiation ATPase DnaA
MNDHLQNFPLNRKPITPHECTIIILHRIAIDNGCTFNELVGPSRARRVYLARCIAYRALYTQGRTKRAIGKIMGGRDHSTVAHGLLR